MLFLEPVTIAVGICCSDWLGLGHVLNEVRGRVISAWNIGTESLIREGIFVLSVLFTAIYPQQWELYLPHGSTHTKNLLNEHGGRLIPQGKFGGFFLKRRKYMPGYNRYFFVVQGSDGSSHTSSCHTLNSELTPSSWNRNRSSWIDVGSS